MRLIGGSSYNEGVVEVYYNGRWGAVCYYGWDEYDANIVCKQLGFKSAEIVDFGTRPAANILLDNLICLSNNTVLASCGHYGIGIKVHCNYHYRSHYVVAGVKCHGMYCNNFSKLMYVYNQGAPMLQELMPSSRLLFGTNISTTEVRNMYVYSLNLYILHYCCIHLVLAHM